MHLLATTSGVVDGGSEAIDLNQAPADVVVLSAADSELANLAFAYDRVAPGYTLRLANHMQLQHNYAVDLYIEKTLSAAKLIVVRLLGGKAYWPYGLDAISALAHEKQIKLIVLEGGQNTNLDLQNLSNVDADTYATLAICLGTGGPDNAEDFIRHCGQVLDFETLSQSPKPFPNAGVYRASKIDAAQVGIVFYRSLLEGGQTAPIDALFEALEQKGLSPQALYVSSLKVSASQHAIAEHWQNIKLFINATSFAIGDAAVDPLVKFDCPVLQVTLAGSSEKQWLQSQSGLGAKDLAMSIVLPELDGRIYTRAISFKSDHLWHQATQCNLVTYKPVTDRIDFVAQLASNWVALSKQQNQDKKIAIVLANYPNKDGRIANGVGYDTPASTIKLLNAFERDGYTCGEFPQDGNALIEALQANRSNAASQKLSATKLSLQDYLEHFNAIPSQAREQITKQWGSPDRDPFFLEGAFQIPLLRFGNVAVGIQPARGYNIDPKSTYHDPALVPPHGYLAFYFYLRYHFKTNAIIHNGKHGNLEWLPGKALSLSENCFPEIAMGPTPQFYPFIVNDPGEGTQAKRRTSAVIIDHLTPPLTRAESYGPLKDLEALVDEYYLASGLDRRRLSDLKSSILDLTKSSRLDQDAGFTGDEEQDLQRLDAYLCDLKEAQIRDGLHILGEAPQGQLRTDLLVALTRVPRGLAQGRDQSLIRALAKDFAFENFDPLDCDLAAVWEQSKPEGLTKTTISPWRTNGDTVERLELFAAALVAKETALPDQFGNTAPVLHHIHDDIVQLLAKSGEGEIQSLLSGLNGKSVPAGSSGAPTRGRLDVLPTGKNFYSVDSRAIPTPTAWNIGKRSAEALLLRHFQDTGSHLKQVGLSVWGTSNMRTGGDDIAQALALLGVEPQWDKTSWRLTGFEIIPPAKLGRPRVDVTLRISGFFRDAFPTQIELLDKAIRAVATLDEDENPLADAVAKDILSHQSNGLSEESAKSLAATRIFGSKPGAYGAGLQALIDEKIWTTRADLAAAYVTWGSYAYGTKLEGVAMQEQFQARLKRIEAVIQNQDNREHDLLDSDDYYQFEGGMSAAVETASGKKPRAYHPDHSRPEKPIIRTLEEEVARVVRSRVVNPKWIKGVKRHGYKGAFEIAATVDYMFAFAATADAVKSHHFDLAYEAYLLDDDTRQFITDNNPAALKEIAGRFQEAITRGLWQPKHNSAYDHLKDLQS